MKDEEKLDIEDIVAGNRDRNLLDDVYYIGGQTAERTDCRRSRTAA